MITFNEMIYTRIEKDQLVKDFKELIRRFDEARSGLEQLAVHEDYYKLTDHVTTMMTLAEIRHDVDMTDEFYAAEQEWYDELSPVYRNLLAEYQRKMLASPYREELQRRIGPVAFKNMELASQSVDEGILDLMTEENKLQNRYNLLMATAQIPWEGENLNLSLMNPYLHSGDRAVRQKAWEAYSHFFAEHQEEFDEIYDKLVKNRTAQAAKLGHDTYLPLGYARMQRNSYGRSDLAQFRKQIKNDLVPFAEEIHKARAARLHLTNMQYFDEGITFPNGNPAPIGTPEQILANGQKMYRELSKETGEFMDFMCERDLFDVLGRKTKKTGGYMTYLPDYKSPFIFANFNGSSSDVDVITHECGHAFQGYLAAADPIREHADITMETAETHSMSMEFFTEPWMELFFGERAKDYVKMHLEDSIVFLPYGTMVDEFQDIIYADPSLSPKARNEVWRDLERQYKPHLDYTGNSLYEGGAFWQNKHHIYDCPLYYIDYCIAGTNALSYKVWMEKDFKGAWESYLKLCRLSASDFFPGLMREAGLNNPFEDGCVDFTVRKLKEMM